MKPIYNKTKQLTEEYSRQELKEKYFKEGFQSAMNLTTITSPPDNSEMEDIKHELGFYKGLSLGLALFFLVKFCQWWLEFVFK